MRFEYKFSESKMITVSGIVDLEGILYYISVWNSLSSIFLDFENCLLAYEICLVKDTCEEIFF